MAVAWLALETHPTGAFAFFLMAAAFFADRPLKPRKIPLPSLAGFLLGSLYYYLLHADVLNARLPGMLLENNRMGGHSIQNFLFDYFFHSKYHRHLVDFALLLFCFIEFFRKKMFTRDPLVLPLSLSLLSFCLLFQRPQYHYVLYFYPVFLLILAKVFETRWNLAWMSWGLLALLVPQYAFAYHLNRDYSYKVEIQNYQKRIPSDTLPILGGPNAWFAFPGRDFYFNRYLGDIRRLGLTRFYLVSDDDYRDKPTEAAIYIAAHFEAKPLGEFSAGHRRYTLALEEPAPGTSP